jgi:transposase InsO family protein
VLSEAKRMHCRKKPDWVTKEVLRLAVFLPSCRAVAGAFNAIHGQRATVGKSYVHEVCRAHESRLRLLRREMRRRPPHAVPVGGAFSLDLTTVRVAGQRRLVLGLIDQGSRLALRLKVLTHKGVWTLLSEVCATIAEHGRPKAIRTDNEAMFTSRAWKVLLKAFGIRHERIGVRCAWQNGRMERFFGTLKPVLAKLSLPSPLALQAALDEFALYYNHVRPHQGLGGLTPAQAWRALTVTDVRRHAGRGRWVQAFDGLLIGYHVRC